MYSLGTSSNKFNDRVSKFLRFLGNLSVLFFNHWFESNHSKRMTQVFFLYGNFLVHDHACGISFRAYDLLLEQNSFTKIYPYVQPFLFIVNYMITNSAVVYLPLQGFASRAFVFSQTAADLWAHAKPELATNPISSRISRLRVFLRRNSQQSTKQFCY